jgi:uncharacterized membrane protein
VGEALMGFLIIIVVILLVCFAVSLSLSREQGEPRGNRARDIEREKTAAGQGKLGDGAAR